MDIRTTLAIVLPILTLACVHRQAGGESAGTTAATVSAPTPAAAPSPTGTPMPAAEIPDFETRIRPLLQEKCSPCHFSGGRMYEQLPFDKEATVRLLGPAMFSRLRDPLDVELLRTFLGEPQ